MDEYEINRILEKTKNKIAISQFKKEKLDNMKTKKENNFVIFKKIGIGIAAGLLLTAGSVGAYVGITGNTEILKKIGINIGEQYDNKKQDVRGTIQTKDFEANLVSVACDSSCIILEMDVKLIEKNNTNIDFEIEKLTLEGNDFIGSTITGLKLSQSSSSNISEDGSIKLFKYISIKDPNLAGDGFLDEIFKDSNKVNCKLEFSNMYDKNTNEIISNEKTELSFNIEGKTKSEYIKVDKVKNIENVSVNIESINKSSLGNYITLTAFQDNFDKNKENNIQKLEYIIKNSNGKEVNIVSKTYNIAQELNDPSKISIETTLKLDDISDDVSYDVDIKIGEKANISTKEIVDAISLNEKISEIKEKKNQEIKLSAIDNNKQSTSDLFIKNPLDKDTIIMKSNKGINVIAQEGDLIYSINNGDVINVGYDSKIGKFITIKYNNIEVIYGTCSEITKKIGDKVNAGDIIAKVGNTGNSTGPHLHLEILENGIEQDPENYLK